LCAATKAHLATPLARICAILLRERLVAGGHDAEGGWAIEPYIVDVMEQYVLAQPT